LDGERWSVLKLPEVDSTFGDLYQVTFAPIRSKLLLTGIELKVFNYLLGPKLAQAVSQALGAFPNKIIEFRLQTS
jgi:hypothetical protein